MRDEFDRCPEPAKVVRLRALGQLRQKTDQVGTFDTEPMTYVREESVALTVDLLSIRGFSNGSIT